MKVIEGCDSRYKFLDLITLKEKEFHVSDMKPFVFDAALTDPLDVVRRDNMEFFIDKILGLDMHKNITLGNRIRPYVIPSSSMLT